MTPRAYLQQVVDRLVSLGETHGPIATDTETVGTRVQVARSRAGRTIRTATVHVSLTTAGALDVLRQAREQAPCGLTLRPTGYVEDQPVITVSSR